MRRCTGCGGSLAIGYGTMMGFAGVYLMRAGGSFDVPATVRVRADRGKGRLPQPITGSSSRIAAIKSGRQFSTMAAAVPSEFAR